MLVRLDQAAPPGEDAAAAPGRRGRIPGAARWAVRSIRRITRYLVDAFRLSLFGVLVAALAAWVSLLPSLLPRTWLYQGVITGIALAAGYLLGWLLHLCWHRLIYPRLPLDKRVDRVAGRILYWLHRAAPSLLALYLVLVTMTAIRAQDQVADLVGAPRPPWSDYMRIPWVALAVFAVLLGLTRLLRALVRLIGTRFRNRFGGPVIVAHTVGAVTVMLLAVFVADAVVPRVWLSGADAVFGSRNGEDYPGVVAPVEPERSGSPASLIDFEDLGREGRGFISGGLRGPELAELLDRPAAEPIRLYAGLASADSDDARAALIVDELERTRAAERSKVVVIPTTGTGWINPAAAQAIELLEAGDVAIVGVQYSYLPSWISFLTDRRSAEDAGRALIGAVVDWRDRLPADGPRPAVYVYGESLGTQAGEAAFDGLSDIRQTVDGVLWIGPPNANRIWRGLVARRDPGSTAVAPVYADGLLVRFTENAAELRDDHSEWLAPRVLYVQQATDPVVWWSPDLLFSRPDWLIEPPGHGRHPGMHYVPIITFWQVTADLGNAVGGSAGYGHDYHPQLLDGWAAVTARPDWDDVTAAGYAELLTEALAG